MLLNTLIGWLLIGGLAAGLVGGALGIGGGIVLMPLLRFVVGLPAPRAAGTCITAVFFTTAGGSCRHLLKGHVRLRSLWPVIAAGALGCVVSSVLFGCLAGRPHWLDLGVGAVFGLVSVRMIADARSREDEHVEPSRLEGSLARKAAIGVAAGVLPGLLGVGTGGLLVPSFRYLLGAPVKVAMASSLACFFVNAALSTAFKIAQGYVAVGVTLPVCLGTLIGSSAGVTLNQRSPSRVLLLLFSLLFLFVSARFILQFGRAVT